MASKTIKGITIEIDGNVTGLGKALKTVDDRSKDLQRSLKYVNEALRFDPSNTELLAEKQDILAKSIETTKEKLEKLRSVQDQVKQQYSDGEIGQSAYIDFQKEIAATTDKLKRLEAEAKDTQGAIDGTGDEAKEAAGKVDTYADAADRADRESKDLGDTLNDKVKSGFKTVAGVVTGAITAVVAATETTKEYRTEMSKLDASFESSGKTAESAEAVYKELYGVIGETDQVVEASQQIALLADSEEDAVKWAELGAGVVGKFGDALQPETFFEAANETIKLGEATGAYVQMLEGCGLDVEEFNKGLAACTTESEKQAYMLSVTESALGRAGELYRQNNADIIAANEASDAWTQSLAGIGEVVMPVTTEIQNMGAALVEQLTPYIAQAAEFVGDLLTKFQELTPEQQENIVSFVALAGAIAVFMNPVGRAIEVVALLVGVLASAYENCEWFREGVDILFGGLADIILNWQQNLDETWTNVKTGLQGLGDGFSQIGNDIQTGWDTAMTTVRDVASERLASMRSAYEENGGGMRGIAAATMSAIEGLYTDGWTAVDRLTGGKLSTLKSTISTKMDEARQKVSDAITKIKGLFNFQWNWPKLKMPHFSITGSFSLSPPKVPKFSVSWYAKGGILDGAQIFGQMGNTLLGGGEAGKEAVLPLNEFYRELEAIMTRIPRGMSGMVVNVNIEHFENARQQDIPELATEVAQELHFRFQQEEAALT